MDALILIVQQQGREPRQVRLTPGLTVGRSRRNACVVEDSELGREQFRIVAAGGELLVEDLGGRNRTRVDGRLLGKGNLCALRPGCTLAAGRTSFHVVADDDETTSVADDDGSVADVDRRAEEAPRGSAAGDGERDGERDGDGDGTIVQARPQPVAATAPADHTIAAPRPGSAPQGRAQPMPQPAGNGDADMLGEATEEMRRPGGDGAAGSAEAPAREGSPPRLQQARPTQEQPEHQQQQQQHERSSVAADAEREPRQRRGDAQDEEMPTVERSRDELKVLSRMSPRRPLLLVKRGTLKRRFQVQDARAVIGRGESCAIRVLEGSVSEEHAELSFDGQGFLLRDLDSANGTRLRDRELANVREDVRCHDLVGFGVVEGVFLTADGTAAASARKLQKQAARRLVRDQRLSREDYREAVRQVSEDGRRHLAEIVLLDTAVEPAEWASSIAAARRARTRARWLWAFVLLLLVAGAAAAVAWRMGWLAWEW